MKEASKKKSYLVNDSLHCLLPSSVMFSSMSKIGYHGHDFILSIISTLGNGLFFV